MARRFLSNILLQESKIRTKRRTTDSAEETKFYLTCNSLTVSLLQGLLNLRERKEIQIDLVKMSQISACFEEAADM